MATTFFKDSHKFKYLNDGNIAYKTNKDTWSNVLLDGITLEDKIKSDNCITNNISTSENHFHYYNKNKNKNKNKYNDKLSHLNRCDNCQEEIVDAYILNVGIKYLLCSKYCMEEIKTTRGCLTCGTYPPNDDYDNGFYYIKMDIDNYEDQSLSRYLGSTYICCEKCYDADVCRYCNYYGGHHTCFMCSDYPYYN